MHSLRLCRAILFAKDMKRMTDFYHDALGLAVVSNQPGWVEFDAGGMRLALHDIPPRVAKQTVNTNPPRAREETPIKLVFEVDDLEASRRYLSARGATMFEPRSWGACDGLDPEGNVFQIVAAAPAEH